MHHQQLMVCQIAASMDSMLCLFTGLTLDLDLIRAWFSLSLMSCAEQVMGTESGWHFYYISLRWLAGAAFLPLLLHVVIDNGSDACAAMNRL